MRRKIGGDGNTYEARAFIGGITSSTLLTLLVVPAPYRIVHRPARVDTVIRNEER